MLASIACRSTCSNPPFPWVNEETWAADRMLVIDLSIPVTTFKKSLKSSTGAEIVHGSSRRVIPRTLINMVGWTSDSTVLVFAVGLRPKMGNKIAACSSRWTKYSSS